MRQQRKISFHTLGCKLNQSETEAIAHEFYLNGYEIIPFGEETDVCVVNTCTVTGRTDAKCRQAIRKAHKNSPNAIIAVVGCYAQMDPDSLYTLPGVKIVLGGDKKFELFQRIEAYFRLKQPMVSQSQNNTFIGAHPGSQLIHTRAFLKIQDGCNNFCSYCIVPYARGRSRSEPMEKVISDIDRLTDYGYNEIVLTGVHIGRYGQDLPNKTNIYELLLELQKREIGTRIRLSSLEPVEISDEMIKLIANSEIVCPHFHIPLQSGDDQVLASMNRHYTTEDFSTLIYKIRENMPTAAIGTDVIVGFPGETEHAFETTRALIEKLPLSYLHVFTYSRRRGTKAAEMKQQIPHVVKKQRSRMLIEMGTVKKNKFYQNSLGKTLKVLFETRNSGREMYGFSENYIKVRSNLNVNYFNKITPVEVIETNEYNVAGTILS